jgi:hypothetical protein
MAKLAYEVVIGANKGKKVTKTEKASFPATRKNVSIVEICLI